MDRLRNADIRSINDFLAEGYGAVPGPEPRRALIAALRRVIDCDIASWNRIDTRTWSTDTATDPAEATVFPDHLAVFERHLHEHPLLANHRLTGDGRAYQFSDFLSIPRLHDLGIYREYYRRIGVEHQIGLALASPSASVVGVALSRRGPRYSERERLLLDALRPHLLQMQRNVEAVERLESEVGLLREAIDRGIGGLVALEPDGRVRVITDGARAALQAYCGGPSRDGQALPDAVRRWLGAALAAPAGVDDVDRPRAPLVIARADARLSLRVVGRREAPLLLLQEQRTAVDAGRLRRLGLTRREADVLRLVAIGSTSAEVGRRLGISGATVAKHLEHIYRRLGVASRTAAAARALAAGPE